MKNAMYALSFFLLFSSYAFSGEITSAGVCIDGVGGKFIFKNLGNSQENIMAYITNNLCDLDTQYTPGSYEEVEFINLNGSTYLKKMSFKNYWNEGEVLTFSEENIQDFSSEQKTAIDNAF